MRIHIGTRGAAALTGVALMLAAACGSSASVGGGSQPAATAAASASVMTARNASLGATVLVNRRGLTLYSLSAERNGRFICTDMSCLNLWHPLIAPSGGLRGDPVGSLGTIRRPGGGEMQVTFHGLPLYTFANDHKPGSVAGNGFKDVGTWQAATTSRGSVSTQPAPPATSSGGGYGY
jgi:predicted lipoprotein with Yx(FWY)xxD motif